MMQGAVATLENMPISVTYNVEMGVGKMEHQQTVSPRLDVTENKEFQKELKAGMYKSLFEDGLISHVVLIRLLERLEQECLG